MKRKYQPLDSADQEQHRNNRKRFTRTQPVQEPLPCKFKLLREWELTEEGLRYLSLKSQIEQHNIRDLTISQMAVVPYYPNQYQHILDDIATASLHFEGETMDIEGVEVYGS